jgi:hypothetical protein
MEADMITPGKAKLTDNTQLITLSGAAQRQDGAVSMQTDEDDPFDLKRSPSLSS